MESGKQNGFSEDSVPSLIDAIAMQEVAGFDSIKLQDDLHKSNGFHHLSISIVEDAVENKLKLIAPQRTPSISISMPSSPVVANEVGILFGDNASEVVGTNIANSAAKFYSQPMPLGSALNGAVAGGNLPLKSPVTNKIKYQRFDSFRTWSGKFERQKSNLRRVHREIEEEPHTDDPCAELETLPVDRFFDALEGPELDTLRASEEIVLPDDEKWPFLLRFPISTFGICLGISSHAILWKALATFEFTKFLHISPIINVILWFVAVALLMIVSFTYGLKIIFYFEAVRREYFHPVRVNFFFAPFVVLLFLALGVPPSVCQKLHSSLWYILMAPILCLELKIYGQWMSGGERRLSKVANPSNHLAVVGNFAGALLGATMGLQEGPIFFFAIGLAHYSVLFVTLYQRLPTNETLPKELHPVFFLFVAAPSTASMAWSGIQGSFDYGSRLVYFIALFLYFSLAVRINFFRGFRFSLAWWAYTFPMSGAALATIKYSCVVPTMATHSLAVVLCAVATLAVVTLLVITLIHACVLKDLFPNDMAIAIRGRTLKITRRWYHKRSRPDSSDSTSAAGSNRVETQKVFM